MLTLRLPLFGSLALAAGLACGSTGTAHAQAYTGAAVLQDPISVRVTSMGQTGTADNSDPANVWFNPANAVGAAGVYVEYGTWKADPFFDLEIPYSRWAAGGSFAAADNVVAGIDATFGELDYGTFPATSSTGETLGMYDIWERYLSVALAVATDLGDHVELRLGAAGKHFWADYGVDVFSQDLDELTPEGFAFDVGVTAAFPAELSGWTVTPALAFAYVNFGGEIEFDNGWSDPFPARLHYGASVRVDGPAVALGSARVPLLSFVNNVDAADRLHGDSYSWGMGAELAVMQVLFLRAGVMDDQDEDRYYDARDQSAWSIGIGVPVGQFRGRFDYARVAGYEEPRYGFTAAWEF